MGAYRTFFLHLVYSLNEFPDESCFPQICINRFMSMVVHFPTEVNQILDSIVWYLFNPKGSL